MNGKTKAVSEELMDDLEPINNMVDEGGPIHPTQYDESDDLEDAKVVEDEYRKLNEFISRGI